MTIAVSVAAAAAAAAAAAVVVMAVVGVMAVMAVMAVMVVIAVMVVVVVAVSLVAVGTGYACPEMAAAAVAAVAASSVVCPLADSDGANDVNTSPHPADGKMDGGDGANLVNPSNGTSQFQSFRQRLHCQHSAGFSLSPPPPPLRADKPATRRKGGSLEHREQADDDAAARSSRSHTCLMAAQRSHARSLSGRAGGAVCGPIFSSFLLSFVPSLPPAALHCPELRGGTVVWWGNGCLPAL